MSTETGPRPIEDVIHAVRDDPANGRLTLAAAGVNADGVACRSEIREHALAIDEPMALGGTDTGPNPVELVLAALGTCQAITYRIWAGLMGIRLDEVRFETEGDIDIAGLLGVREGVRPGLGGIRHRVILIGPETEDRYRELMAAVDEHCPVLDIVTNPVPVEHALEVRRSG
jgi:putative redox protein